MSWVFPLFRCRCPPDASPPVRTSSVRREPALPRLKSFLRNGRRTSRPQNALRYSPGRSSSMERREAISFMHGMKDLSIRTLPGRERDTKPICFMAGREVYWPRRYGAKFEREVVTPLPQSVLSEPEFAGKEFAVSIHWRNRSGKRLSAQSALYGNRCGQPSSQLVSLRDLGSQDQAEIKSDALLGTLFSLFLGAVGVYFAP